MIIDIASLAPMAHKTGAFEGNDSQSGLGLILSLRILPPSSNSSEYGKSTLGGGKEGTKSPDVVGAFGTGASSGTSSV